ncbi:MAG: glycosyltransferase family 2 protein [Bacteroidales bacterium]|nr:glycosyltransferase family 2 protein [Bacteroidales bacterium]
MNPQVSIIIVNFNSEEYLPGCLDSIANQVRNIEYEIIIVDNASQPSSIQFVRDNYSEVRLIINDKNLGFGAANNRGAKEARGKYLFFLNPDTLLLDNAALRFYQFLEEEKPEAVACGGSLISSEGHPITSYGNFPSLLQEVGDMGFRRFFQSYYDRYLSIGKKADELQTPIRVPYITGADIFVRKQVFFEVGGFDENFFLYYEETDLFYRLHQKGLVSFLLPDVKIIHLEGPALMKENKLNLEKWPVWEQSKYYYYRKHKGIIVSLLVKKIQLLSLVFHYLFGPMKYPLLKTLKTTWKA